MSLSIEQALDKIYEALKGAETDGQGSIEYSLTKIAETLETGSNVNLPAVTSDDNGDVLTVVEGNWSKADIPSQLPTVTTTDNGDVLTVVEGEWAKAVPSGGVSPLICTPSVSGGICSLDKTFKEIKEAFEAGSPIHILDESVYTTVTIILLQNRTVKDDYGNQFVADSDDEYPCFEV